MTLLYSLIRHLKGAIKLIQKVITFFSNFKFLVSRRSARVWNSTYFWGLWAKYFWVTQHTSSIAWNKSKVRDRESLDYQIYIMKNAILTLYDKLLLQLHRYTCPMSLHSQNTICTKNKLIFLAIAIELKPTCEARISTSKSIRLSTIVPSLTTYCNGTNKGHLIQFS